jgi:hypothetical protein
VQGDRVWKIATNRHIHLAADRPEASASSTKQEEAPMIAVRFLRWLPVDRGTG